MFTLQAEGTDMNSQNGALLGAYLAVSLFFVRQAELPGRDRLPPAPPPGPIRLLFVPPKGPLPVPDHPGPGPFHGLREPSGGHRETRPGPQPAAAERHRPGKALEKEAGGLKRQLNASQTETRLARGQATALNNTLRACVHEKIAQECMFNLHFLNLSCPVQVAAHQEQLMALQARAKMAQEDFALKAKLLQGQADQVAKEKEACLVEKLEMQARSDKYRELEAKVLSELEPARQKLASAVDQALSGRALAGCYHSEIAGLRERCQDLSGQLRAQLESLGREVDQKVQEVSQENGALRRQKESCALHLQERDRRLSAQQDQAEREKRILRESQEAELRKALAEQQKLAREKEELQIQLEQSKQACLRMRINPAPPANPALRLPGGSAVGANPAASFPGLLGNAGP
ncbi:hypothetical protein JRQ81_008920 [Phrynocephalus forsythii]|uniref:Uncharacterized protein n=1 Tax=Phrynocephalus forsythii TaxID=171643 RepID=A0A9Q0XAY6_9SAUR|nr:hypothetical protein JRQ81_008920 [Phrynocephalus forsythii]